MVDEYEEEWIEITALEQLLTAIDAVVSTVREPEILAIIRELRTLTVDAMTLSRPLLFVL
jgi:hypothetical protein